MLKCTLLILLSVISFAILGQTAVTDSISDKRVKEEKNVDFNVMPFMSYNRNLKFMYGALPMAMYKLNPNDTISPKSLSGIAAMLTTNGSKFISLFNQFHFGEGKWRVHLVFATGNHFSQFYYDYGVPAGFYDYETISTIVSGGFKRKVFKTLYAGLNYTFAHHSTSYEDDILTESNTVTNSLAYVALWDSRDAVYYPTTGKQIKLRWNSFPEWFGNDVKANKIVSEYNQYFPVRDGADVIAARFAGTFGLGDISFEQQVVVGGKDIRGYSEGKYRGDGIMACQGEYRYNFAKRMGLVGFAGIATIYGSSNKDFDWGLYPGVGVGYRYQAFKSAKFNIGLDGAVGKDDWGVYFRIGEAF